MAATWQCVSPGNIMKMPFFPRIRRQASIEALYGAIVAQARLPAFYRAYGVPDTVDGRLEMIILHLSLVLARLVNEPQALRDPGQGVFDLFCHDMDDHMRQQGVGDLAVPKAMQKIGEAFYGRDAAYRAALAAGDDAALSGALARNVFGAPDAASADRLARYMREAARQLAAQDAGAIAAARLAWPDPGAISAPVDQRAEALPQ